MKRKANKERYNGSTLTSFLGHMPSDTLKNHENNHQDEASREARLKSNSLEDIFEPQNRRSCFVEQKGGCTSSGSVPSMTDTVGSCSWSCSSPESGGK